MTWLIRHTTLVSLLIAAGLSGIVYSLKHEVQALEDELAGLNRTIAEERETIHVLEAEWSHLNEPSRLKVLAQRHLGLRAMETSQLGSLSALPIRPPIAVQDVVAQAPVLSETIIPRAWLKKTGVRQ